MKDNESGTEFRVEARKWLEQHSGEAPVGGDHHQLLDWQARLAEAHLLGVTWPPEYGGSGLTQNEAIIAQEELERAGVPSVFDILGIEIFGPTFLHHADDAQKRRFLPAILRGEEPWCQLFSEPSAGSDLAGVRTRARTTESGSWVVSGQKVWTTNAQFATYGAALVRTDPNVPKHKGLTMIVVPMDAPGVTVRGLRQISGESEFNEVFLDEVEVPAENIIGGLGNGWAVAMTALTFERSSMALSGVGMTLRAERFARALLDRPDLIDDTSVLRRLGAVSVELLAVAEGSARTAAGIRRGEGPSPTVGLDKVTMVNAALNGCELLADVLGPDIFEEPDGPLAYLVSFLPGLRSAGGTEEILRTSIGERVLGLPAEPRLDKSLPFAELPGGGR